MAIYTSSTNRLTGLSGIDTDSMVDKLMYAESAKLFRYQRNLQWKQWQQNAYRTVIDQFKTFQNKWFSASNMSTNLRYSSSFNKYTSSVTGKDGEDSKAISVTKSTGDVSYEIQVEQLAKYDTYKSTGNVVSKISGNFDKAAVAEAINKNGKAEFSVTLDGISKTITFTKKDFVDGGAAGVTISDSDFESAFNNKLADTFGTETVGGNEKNKISVTVSNGKFDMTAITGHTIKIADGSASSKSIDLSEIGSEAKSKGDIKFKVTINGKETEVSIKPDDKGKSTIEKRINTALQNTNMAGSNTKLSAYVSASVDSSGNLVFTSTEKGSSSNVKISDLSVAGVDLDGAELVANSTKTFIGVTSGSSNTLNINNVTMEDLLGKGNADGTFTINGKKIKYTADTNLATFLKKINDSGAGVTAAYNTTTEGFTFKSNDGGKVNNIKFGTDSSTAAVLSAMKIDPTGASGHTEGQDAILIIDGVRTTRSTNSFDLDGMSITLNAETNGETIKLGSKYDIDSVYSMVEEFVNDYNTLIADLNSKIKETRAKSDKYSHYEPLTDMQKEEMDSEDIELWEEKAKTGLLYKDDIITGLLSRMRSSLYSSIKLDDGSSMALYQIGITTSSNYTDNGKLVIDEEKLKAAISEKGSSIVELFTRSKEGLADQMNTIIESAIGTKGSLRDRAGIEGTASVDQNILSKAIKELNEKITAEKEKLASKETNYYKMFSSMESAMTSMDSQLSALQSMLGM